MFERMLKNLQMMFIKFSTNHPKKIMVGGFLITIIFLGAFPMIKTDTDPVHMLPQDNPVVVLHNSVKKEFNVSDIVALGIQSKNGDSLFNNRANNRGRRCLVYFIL